MESKKQTKKQPVVNANSHGVSVAIWNNTNAQGKEYQSLSMNASSKQTDGSYKNRTIFFPSDLENLINALTELKIEADEQKIKTKFVVKE
jgi:hypothetical protein